MEQAQSRVKMPARQRLYEIVEVGASDDFVSRLYDFVSIGFLLLNLIVLLLDTFAPLHERCGTVFGVIETVTIIFFVIDYFLHIICAQYAWPKLSGAKAVLRYIFSFRGIVDLLSFLPHFLPVFLPAGAVAFKMFRIVRVFRLFRINAYYDSLNVITDVLRRKKQQLLSSVFVILVLMIASSMCMYSLEHEAQPEVFSNAFSGVWWSVSTLLTVGYGDIYPITVLGKLFGTIITFLGVGMVAIPTGIISAGFVEQYSQVKKKAEFAEENDIQFMKLQITEEDAWAGKKIGELSLPHGMLATAIRRGRDIVIPKADTGLLAGDMLVLGAQAHQDDVDIELKEVVLGKYNSWNDQKIRDIDLSRNTLIVMLERGDRVLTPNADTVLREGDRLILYARTPVSRMNTIRI